MTNRKVAKSKRPEAERAAEWACMEVMGCVDTRRALRTKFTRVDFMGCDVIAVKPNGCKIWVQITAGQINAVITRRKKLEAYPWHPSERVFVWQLVERALVANPRKKEWFFRVWEYVRNGKTRQWSDQCDPIPVKSEWFKALPKERQGSEQQQLQDSTQ